MQKSSIRDRKNQDSYKEVVGLRTIQLLHFGTTQENNLAMNQHLHLPGRIVPIESLLVRMMVPLHIWLIKSRPRYFRVSAALLPLKRSNWRSSCCWWWMQRDITSGKLAWRMPMPWSSWWTQMTITIGRHSWSPIVSFNFSGLSVRPRRLTSDLERSDATLTIRRSTEGKKKNQRKIMNSMTIWRTKGYETRYYKVSVGYVSCSTHTQS